MMSHFSCLAAAVLSQDYMLMQPTTIMNLKDQWILTRSVTLLIKAL
jgi:hypothetical protein